jgi:hypothetical protein
MNVQELVVYCISYSFGFSVVLYVFGSIPGIISTFTRWK